MDDVVEGDDIVAERGAKSESALDFCVGGRGVPRDVEVVEHCYERIVSWCGLEARDVLIVLAVTKI